MDVVQHVYRFIGWPLTLALERTLYNWLEADDRKHQAGGPHDYTPEQFGLSAEQIRQDFAAYRKQHIEE
ncbi:MAG TPA: sulfotransferase, partial [Nevskiaceae bacterium]|nr:sulfotransferase [Nevskiaceae bacterium]